MLPPCGPSLLRPALRHGCADVTCLVARFVRERKRRAALSLQVAAGGFLRLPASLRADRGDPSARPSAPLLALLATMQGDRRPEPVPKPI